MAETSADVVRRYLEDAIAAERNFETQLQDFASQTENPAAKSAFEQRARATRKQHERLTARLEILGGSVSGAKTLLSHIFGLRSKTLPHGHPTNGLTTHNLMLAFAIENSELAMYEALAAIAEAAGDPETAVLARSNQSEEKTAAENLWRILSKVAFEDYEQATRETADEYAKGATV